MKKVVTFGEIMLRLAPPEFLRFSQTNSFDVVYGGGESNVAVSLANYGVPVEFVTRLPKNDIGQCALMEMRKRNVGTQHIIQGGDRLGIYFLETGAVSRGSKVVYDRAHSAMSEIQPGMVNWKEVFQEAQVVSLDGNHPCDFSKCCRRLPRSSKSSQRNGSDYFYRFKLPCKTLEVRRGS
jgi:2-dehydro-3-deoxygluconokinase